MRQLLFLLLLPPQLTWYELYERGEKHFNKGQYKQSIEHMKDALILNDRPKSNQFTRANQKIDYKPYYYLALAHQNQGHLLQAYENAQKAYQSEVVRETPLLQSELAPILEAWRDRVAEHHQQYTAEQATIAERTRLLAKLAAGELEEVGNRLAGLSEPAKFEDIRLQWNMHQQLRARTNQVIEDIISHVESLIQGDRQQLAREFFETMKERLPQQTRNDLAQRLASLPPPSEPNTSEPSPPNEHSQSTQLEQEVADFKIRFKDLQALQAGTSKELGKMRTSNLELKTKLAENRQAEPQQLASPLLVVTQSTAQKLRVRADITSEITHWQIFLNGEELNAPEVSVTEQHKYSLDLEVTAPSYGQQVVRLLITDDMGKQASTSKTIHMERPFYLKRSFQISLGTLLLLALIGWWLLIRTRRRRARLRHFNPYIAGSPVHHVGMFYGREALMSRIQGLVHKNSFMIFGARRIGKTSLLLHLKKNLLALKSPDYRFYPAFIDLQGVHEQDLFHHMMAELLIQATDWGIELKGLTFKESEIGAYQARQFSKDIKQLITRLRAQQAEHVQLVLLMDEVDVLNAFSEKSNQKLRGIFMKEYAEHLSCVMAGIHLKKEWDSAGSPWYNFFEQIPVDAFDPTHARRLILDPVKGIFRYEPGAVSLIIAGTDCHPYLIQKVCVSLIGEKLKQGRFLISEQDAVAALEKLNEEIQRNKYELHHQPLG